MQEYKDMKDMIEILGIAIVRESNEEDFFLRSANASTSEVARQLYLEIAEDFGEHRQNLEDRKQKLESALQELISNKRSQNQNGR